MSAAVRRPTRSPLGNQRKVPKPADKRVLTAPQIIVASVLAYEDRFLFMEEFVNGALCINQPAGCLEFGESPVVGVVRETWEKSGVGFEPSHLIGLYSWHSHAEQKHYVRLAYTGQIVDLGNGRPSDPAIEQVSWLDLPQLVAQTDRHRSPFVMACVEDYLRGICYPLDLVTQFYES